MDNPGQDTRPTNADGAAPQLPPRHFGPATSTSSWPLSWPSSWPLSLRASYHPLPCADLSCVISTQRLLRLGQSEMRRHWRATPSSRGPPPAPSPGAAQPQRETLEQRYRGAARVATRSAATVARRAVPTDASQAVAAADAARARGVITSPPWSRPLLRLAPTRARVPVGIPSSVCPAFGTSPSAPFYQRCIVTQCNEDVNPFRKLFRRLFSSVFRECAANNSDRTMRWTL